MPQSPYQPQGQPENTSFNSYGLPSLSGNQGKNPYPPSPEASGQVSDPYNYLQQDRVLIPVRYDVHQTPPGQPPHAGPPPGQIPHDHQLPDQKPYNWQPPNQSPSNGWPPSRKKKDNSRVWGVLLLLFLLVLASWNAGFFDPVEEGDKDSDGDGVPNSEDAFPDDPTETIDTDRDGTGDNGDTDDDNDGVNDTQDIDPQNDLAIYFSFQWSNITQPIGKRSWGRFYFYLYQDGELLQRVDNDGDPWQVSWEEPCTLDVGILVNVPDNMSSHSFQIKAHAYSRWTNYLLDLSSANDSYVANFTIDLPGLQETNTTTLLLDGRTDNMSDELDVQIFLEAELKYFGYRVDYSWNYNEQSYQLSYNFDEAVYYHYQGLSHKVRDYDDFLRFATPKDELLVDFAGELHKLTEKEGFDEVEEASFLLSFVQSLKYTADNVTTGIGEYPRYPIETLVDQNGDCEDTAILLASLAEALGIQAALILLPDAAEDAGHAAAGLAVNATGSYYNSGELNYYYAETTSPGWDIGEMPELDSSEAYVYAV